TDAAMAAADSAESVERVHALIFSSPSAHSAVRFVRRAGNRTATPAEGAESSIRKVRLRFRPRRAKSASISEDQRSSCSHEAFVRRLDRRGSGTLIFADLH